MIRVRIATIHPVAKLHGIPRAIFGPRSPASFEAHGSRKSASARSVSTARWYAIQNAVSETFSIIASLTPCRLSLHKPEVAAAPFIRLCLNLNEAELRPFIKLTAPVAPANKNSPPEHGFAEASAGISALRGMPWPSEPAPPSLALARSSAIAN